MGILKGLQLSLGLLSIVLLKSGTLRIKDVLVTSEFTSYCSYTFGTLNNSGLGLCLSNAGIDVTWTVDSLVMSAFDSSNLMSSGIGLTSNTSLLL